MSKKKVVKQKSLDLGDYIGELETKLKEGFKGKIRDVSPITNTMFFKDSEKTYDQRDGYAVLVDVDDGSEFTTWFSKPNAKGYLQSNLYMFKTRYGSIPKAGLEVDVIIDENGFYRIKF